MSQPVVSGKPHNPGFPYTSTEAAQRMIDKISGDPGAWSQGIQRSPTDIPAAGSTDQAEANFKAAMLKVLNDKLRQAGLKTISMAEFKAACAAAAMSWGDGVARKADKIKPKVAAAVDVTYDVADEVRKMPSGLPGSSANKARMTSYFDKRVAAKEARGT